MFLWPDKAIYISDNLTTDKSQNLRPEEAVENGNLSSSFYTIGLTSIAEFCLINYHVLSVLVAVLFIFQGNCGAWSGRGTEEWFSH